MIGKSGQEINIDKFSVIIANMRENRYHSWDQGSVQDKYIKE